MFRRALEYFELGNMHQDVRDAQAHIVLWTDATATRRLVAMRAGHAPKKHTESRRLLLVEEFVASHAIEPTLVANQCPSGVADELFVDGRVEVDCDGTHALDVVLQHAQASQYNENGSIHLSFAQAVAREALPHDDHSRHATCATAPRPAPTIDRTLSPRKASRRSCELRTLARYGRRHRGELPCMAMTVIHGPPSPKNGKSTLTIGMPPRCTG